MDLCIGLATELDKSEFVIEAKRMHVKLTGESLVNKDFTVNLERRLAA